MTSPLHLRVGCKTSGQKTTAQRGSAKLATRSYWGIIDVDTRSQPYRAGPDDLQIFCYRSTPELLCIRRSRGLSTEDTLHL
jgi:hypothetical protein